MEERQLAEYRAVRERESIEHLQQVLTVSFISDEARKSISAALEKLEVNLQRNEAAVI
jgi:predicted RNA binding protein with dsRBD fold (UPF0201 family)